MTETVGLFKDETLTIDRIWQISIGNKQINLGIKIINHVGRELFFDVDYSQSKEFEGPLVITIKKVPGWKHRLRNKL